MDTKRKQQTFGAAAVLALFLGHCGGGGSSPTELPAGDGAILFSDHGCACGAAGQPFTPLGITVDGKAAGQLPVFGKLTVPVAPGNHTWADDVGDGGSVVVKLGGTASVSIFVNQACSDGCVPSD